MAGDQPAAPVPDDELPEDGRTEELVSYLDGELSPEQADELEAELGRDRKLRNDADSLKRAWDLLDFLPKPEPSPNFTERTLSQIAPLQHLPATGSSLTRSPSLMGVSPPIVSRSGETIQPVRKPIASLRWGALFGVALVLGWLVQRPLQQAFGSREDKNADAQLLSELRLLKNLKYYRQIDDFSFLQALDHPELFAEEPFNREESR